MDSRYYLGIFEGHADPAVALVSGGEILAFAEEERFTRQKHAWGVYPIKSLKFCLNTVGISLSDIAAVGLNWNIDAFSSGQMQAFYDQLSNEFEIDDATRGWQRSLTTRFHRSNTENRHHFEWRK